MQAGMRIVILNKATKEGFIDRVTFEQAPKGGEKIIHGPNRTCMSPLVEWRILSRGVAWADLYFNRETICKAIELIQVKNDSDLVLEVEVVRNTLLIYFKGRGRRWNKRKREVKYKTRDFDLGNWKDGVAIDWNEEDCGKSLLEEEDQEFSFGLGNLSCLRYLSRDVKLAVRDMHLQFREV